MYLTKFTSFRSLWTTKSLQNRKPLMNCTLSVHLEWKDTARVKINSFSFCCKQPRIWKQQTISEQTINQSVWSYNVWFATLTQMKTNKYGTHFKTAPCLWTRHWYDHQVRIKSSPPFPVKCSHTLFLSYPFIPFSYPFISHFDCEVITPLHHYQWRIRSKVSHFYWNAPGVYGSNSNSYILGWNAWTIL